MLVYSLLSEPPYLNFQSASMKKKARENLQYHITLLIYVCYLSNTVRGWSFFQLTFFSTKSNFATSRRIELVGETEKKNNKNNLKKYFSF